MASRKPEIKAFFDEATFTVSYVVWDAETHDAAVIDPVLDYEPRGGRIATRSADKILAFLAEERLHLSRILETHAHADHLSAAFHIKAKSGARIGIGDHIGQVQKTFRALFNAKDVSETGAEFDDLFADGTKIPLGGLTIEVMYTPGHTPACVSYRIGDAVFVGDTLFMPDYGTARADFPGGDAEALYRSIRRILSLPPETRLFMCHDYKAEGRDFFAWETTVGAEREKNIHIHDRVDEAAFLAMRKARDATLAPPLLLLPSIQVNIRAGNLPPPESNGRRYLKIPLTIELSVANSGQAATGN